MELTKINAEIIKEIGTLREARDTLKLRSQDKATAKGEYEMKLAQTMIKLKNGQRVKLGDEEVSYTSATGLKEISKGICFKESIKQDLTESAYKSAIVAMEACKATINAYQSILRYSEDV